MKQKEKYPFYELTMPNKGVDKLYSSQIVHSMLLDVLIKGQRENGNWYQLITDMDKEITESPNEI